MTRTRLKGTAAVSVYKWILADNTAGITKTTKVTDLPIEEAGNEKRAKVVGTACETCAAA